MSPTALTVGRPPVLAVLEKHYCRIPSHESREMDEMAEALEAVRELVAACEALRGKRGAIMALVQTDARSRRFFAALARVRGAA